MTLYNNNIETIERSFSNSDEGENKRRVLLYYGLIPSREVLDNDLIIVKGLNGGIHTYDVETGKWTFDG